MSVYEIVTERIIKALESGTVPWKKPWVGGTPTNLVSRKPYRGINRYLLSGRNSQYWVSYKQMVALGGTLKEDDKKASMAVFWKWLDPKDAKPGEEDRKIPLLRYYNVFNLDQIDGIEAPATEKLEFTPVERAEQVIAAYPNPPKIKTKGDQACYIPKLDEIDMPKKEDFTSVPGYYSTLFHEMTHSTGHEKRLDRGMDATAFASESYSKEELVAEIGASFLMAETGIEADFSKSNSEAYIKGWLDRLNGDKKFVVFAAAAAQRAVDHILDRKVVAQE
jgi:antirestriction protein ArdC